MPELSVKEVRLPELHLPELSRDDIVRALSEDRLRDVELPRDEITTVRRGRLDLSGLDLGRALGGVAIVARFARPVIRRPRLSIAIGVVVALGLIGLAVSRSPAVREGADGAARRARERFEAMRSPVEDDVIEPAPAAIDPVASDVAETMASTGEAPAPLAAPV